jgi:acetylornithine deacetylase
MQTLDILDRLIAFPTVSRQSNLALIGYLRELLEPAGIDCRLVASPDGSRANLYATVGPADRGGVVLSGHTDVVPVEGQAWSSDPFKLRAQDGRYYGRGTADMKGFVAVAVAAALRAAGRSLRTPLHLALSYDEEIGCVGVRGLLDDLAGRSPSPRMCIVGEPTEFKIATGHKGKMALKATCTGREGHSALAPDALNALHLGADFLNALRRRQARLAETGARDNGFDVPYTTIHAGRMQGGTALNIVPNRCEIDFEIRNIAADDPREIFDGIRTDADAIAARHTRRFPEARVDVEQTNAYPELEIPTDTGVVALLRELTGENGTRKVAFGTEGGLFKQRLGLETAICGPGSMEQGHKPDEFVTGEQLSACEAMLDRLIARLEIGL